MTIWLYFCLAVDTGFCATTIISIDFPGPTVPENACEVFERPAVEQWMASHPMLRPMMSRCTINPGRDA